LTLVVCATPIGNLDDVTLRVLQALRDADVVLCEDTRHTRLLLARYGISARLLSYHEHNEAERTAELLPRLEEGELVALVSDAGLPAISDPGARLIAAALESGVAVSVLPGASAVETALVASGLVGEQYQFVGYLPRGERALLELGEELARRPWTVVAFESPQRLPRSLRVLARVVPDRPAAVCRELTKRFEEVAPGTVAELAERFPEAVRGEVTLVVGGAAVSRDETGAEEAVAELVRSGVPRRRAAAIVSKLTGVPRNRLYRSSL
jgi:16S rRNA (cytidine1402-2'-O)-methyltransferase